LCETKTGNKGAPDHRLRIYQFCEWVEADINAIPKKENVAQWPTTRIDVVVDNFGRYRKLVAERG
jgi:hypothetical protein